MIFLQANFIHTYMEVILVMVIEKLKFFQPIGFVIWILDRFSLVLHCVDVYKQWMSLDCSLLRTLY